MQVPAEEKLIELEPGQVIPITQNRKRLKYTIYDKDYDSDQDIEFIEEEQPQLLLKRGIVSREIKTRDVNDTSYRNLGNFIIYADINTDTTSITIDDNTPLTYSIEQYNQEHGTNYIGFNSITLDINTSEMALNIDIEKSFLQAVTILFQHGTEENQLVILLIIILIELKIFMNIKPTTN